MLSAPSVRPRAAIGSVTADPGASRENRSRTSPGGSVRPTACSTSGTLISCPEASARMIGALGVRAASRSAA
jgi:hypothetical protein